MESIYQEHGYSDREAYLKSLAEDYEVREYDVCLLADMYGPAEDFDGLVTMVESISGKFQ